MGRILEPYADYPQISRILDRLYVGTLYGARQLLTNNPYGIDVVVNCTCEDFNKDGLHDPASAGISVIQVPLNDGESMPPSKVHLAMLSIESALADGKTVLVNCHAGISRSVTIVATYMYMTGWNLDSAIDFIKKKRPIANPHPILTASIKRHLGLVPIGAEAGNGAG